MLCCKFRNKIVFCFVVTIERYPTRRVYSSKATIVESFSFPGTDKERGITAWKNPEQDDSADFIEGPEVYEPLLPGCLKRRRCLRFLPFFPKYYTENTMQNGNYNEGFSDGYTTECNTKV